MGKGRKNRKPHGGRTPSPVPPTPQATPRPSPPGAFNHALLRRTAWQLAALAGLSTVLGFAFNAANPVGIRFENAVSSAAVKPGGDRKDFSLISTHSVATVVTPGQTGEVVSPPRPPLPRPPTTTSAPTQAVATVAQPVARSLPQPAPPPVAKTNLNPAPIHWQEAKPLVAAGQAVLVDVRVRPAYDAGHIPDAISLPETTSPGEFAAFLNQLPTNLTLIVYCSSTSCSQSQRVANRLVLEFHWPAVKFMTGGYQEYQREELAKPQPRNPS